MWLYYDISNDDSAIKTKTLKNSSNNDKTFHFVISIDEIISGGWRPCGQSTGTFCK